jgi:hypothetical protein
MKKIVASFFLFFTAGAAYSSGYTETYYCDTCNYETSAELAKTLHDAPRCVLSDLDSSLRSVGSTSYSCEATTKELIVTNPLTRAAFKFKVATEQASSFDNTYNIIVSDKSIDNFESSALNTFYAIDAEFRDAVQERMQQPIETFVSTLAINSDEDGDCKSHPANFLVNEDFRTNLYEQLSKNITDRMDYNESWTSFSSASNISDGLQISSRSDAGLSINFSRNLVDVFAVQHFGDPDNVFSFTVTYAGEYRGEYGLQWGSVIPAFGRELNLILSFKLNSGASRLERTPVNELLSGQTLEGSSLSDCFKKILEKDADQVTRTPMS